MKISLVVQSSFIKRNTVFLGKYGLVERCSSTVSAQLQLLAVLGRVIKVIETPQPSSYNIKFISDSTVETLGRICCLILFQGKYRGVQNGESANQDLLFKFNLKN